MEDFNINSLILLLQLLRFKRIDESDADEKDIKENAIIHMAANNIKIQIKCSTSSDKIPKLPELPNTTKQLIQEKLSSIFDVIYDNNPIRNTSDKRDTAINVSRSFTINHNVVLNNWDCHDLSASPPIRSSSPKDRQCVSGNGGRKNVADLLRKAKNLIDIAMDMSSNENSREKAMNSTFTKDETAETEKKRKRLSNITKVTALSPKDGISIPILGDYIQLDKTTQLFDSYSQKDESPAAKKSNILARKSNKPTTPRILANASPMEKAWQKPVSRIGKLRQPNYLTPNKNTLINKENHVDTPRPIIPTKYRSTSHLTITNPYKNALVNGILNRNSKIPSPSFLTPTNKSKFLKVPTITPK